MFVFNIVVNDDFDGKMALKLIIKPPGMEF